MGQPSWIESGILSAVIVISLILFWRAFGPVLAILRKSKKSGEFRWGAMGPRVRDFVWEVLLQAKVIRERPAPGIAHAFVFWGFLAFALISANHVAEGYGLHLISRQSVFGRFYFLFAGAFAAAVAVSIAALFFRRFVIRPRWLGKVSYESGVIAVLIFLLMVTYLAQFFLMEGTPAGKANWWVHALSLFIFLPLIPHTKHLHLIFSPFAIFAKRPGFSDIPPLQGDDDFGLTAGPDVTQLDSLQAFSCVECGRCTEHCPASNTGKVLNPKEVILGLREYLKDEGPASQQPLLEMHISEEAIFQCLTCGACEYQCPVGIQHLPIIVGLRRGAVNTGTWEDPYGSKLFLAMERNGNALGFTPGERQKFIEKLELPYFDGSQEYCLWMGCMGSYDPQGREILASLVKILRHCQISFGVLRKERCNGDPARRLGNDLLFSTMAQGNIENLDACKPKKLLSICPHCVRTIGTDWQEFGAHYEVEHHSELLARIQDRLPPAADMGGIAYHDPCYLGRYRGVYDPPRGVVAEAGTLIEAPRNRERSFCCGAGGGQMFLGEEKGKRVNVARAEELVATGAPTIAAACPFCQTMFRDALKQVTEHPPQLLDIAQIAAARIPPAQ